MFWLNFSIWVFFLAPPFLKSLQVSFVWRSTHILLPPQNIGLFSHFLFHFFFIVQPKTILLFRFIFFYLGGYQSIWRFSNRKPYFLQFLFFLVFFLHRKTEVSVFFYFPSNFEPKFKPRLKNILESAEKIVFLLVRIINFCTTGCRRLYLPRRVKSQRKNWINVLDQNLKKQV